MIYFIYFITKPLVWLIRNIIIEQIIMINALYFNQFALIYIQSFLFNFYLISQNLFILNQIIDIIINNVDKQLSILITIFYNSL